MQTVTKQDQNHQPEQLQPQHSKRLQSILLSKSYAKKTASTQQMDSRQEAELRLEKLFRNMM